MTRSIQQGRVLLAAVALALLLPLTGSVQVIPVKTVPVLEGPSMGTVPYQNLLLSGLDFMLPDRLAEPFSNPARGALVDGVVMGSRPSFFRATGNLGSENYFPLSVQFSSPRGFGGLMAAMQRSEFFSSSGLFPLGSGGAARPRESNFLVQAYGGRTLGAGRWSIGAGLGLAHLNGLMAVPLLYNQNVTSQSGYILTASAGLLHRFAKGKVFDATFLVQNFQMEHFFGISPILSPDVGSGYGEKDHTVTWAWRLRYSTPLAMPGDRLGWQFTVNRKSHPKIPNYSLMNIPRDPGVTWAFQAGAGFSRETDQGQYGLEVIYEPIWSHTWVEPLGSEPVPLENFFRFGNWRFNFAAVTRGEALNVGVGIRLHRIAYRLRQVRYVFLDPIVVPPVPEAPATLERKDRYHWLEWEPYLGFRYRLGGVQVQYVAQFALGTGRPGVSLLVPAQTESMFATGNYLIAPAGPLSLQEEVGFYHQINLVFHLE